MLTVEQIDSLQEKVDAMIEIVNGSEMKKLTRKLVTDTIANDKKIRDYIFAYISNIPYFDGCYIIDYDDDEDSLMFIVGKTVDDEEIRYTGNMEYKV